MHGVQFSQNDNKPPNEQIDQWRKRGSRLVNMGKRSWRQCFVSYHTMLPFVNVVFCHVHFQLNEILQLRPTDKQP